MGSAVIYRQEIIPDITLFTSEPKARFYSDLFAHLDLSGFPDNISAAGRKGFSNRAKLRAAIVMKCECFSCITDLLDYLQNNLLIAHYCGFNIMKPLPSYQIERLYLQINYLPDANAIFMSCVRTLFQYSSTEPTLFPPRISHSNARASIFKFPNPVGEYSLIFSLEYSEILFS